MTEATGTTADMAPRTPAGAPRDRRELVLLVLAILLVSLNLRSMLTVIGPLIRDVREGDGLSSAAAGLLAATPLLAFGLISPLGPGFAARFGIERTLAASMIALSISLALRPLPSVVLLFAGTLAAGAAIAVANVLLPALVKRRFGEQATFITGIYSVALGVGAALAAGLAVPSERWLGDSWRAALAVWAVPALLSALLWLPLVRDVPDRGAASPRVRVSLWRDRVAWSVTGYMALLAVQFYSMVAWLPEIYRHEGMSKGAAGALLSLSLTVGIPMGFVVGALAGRMRDQRPIVLAAGVAGLAGWIGVLAAPSAVPSLWAILLGLGFGLGFTLVLALFVLRADDAPHAVALSGMAQSVGYTLAAIGPIAVGALHDLTGGWTTPLVVLVGVAAVDLAIGLGAGRARVVGGRAIGDREPSHREPDPVAAGAGAPR
ncbi:MAG TPA: MFS transporter [Conexibacter sp.]|jgi:CP family cyanate transporter-like MFS transporter|nr:MFS transporter [Conexibacter sp.]